MRKEMKNLNVMNINVSNIWKMSVVSESHERRRKWQEGKEKKKKAKRY